MGDRRTTVCRAGVAVFDLGLEPRFEGIPAVIETRVGFERDLDDAIRRKLRRHLGGDVEDLHDVRLRQFRRWRGRWLGGGGLLALLGKRRELHGVTSLVPLSRRDHAICGQARPRGTITQHTVESPPPRRHFLGRVWDMTSVSCSRRTRMFVARGNFRARNRAAEPQNDSSPPRRLVPSAILTVVVPVLESRSMPQMKASTLSSRVSPWGDLSPSFPRCKSFSRDFMVLLLLRHAYGQPSRGVGTSISFVEPRRDEC